MHRTFVLVGFVWSLCGISFLQSQVLPAPPTIENQLLRPPAQRSGLSDEKLIATIEAGMKARALLRDARVEAAVAAGHPRHLFHTNGDLRAYLRDVRPDGRPLYVGDLNVNAAISTNAHRVRNDSDFQGVDGAMDNHPLWIGVWESGGGSQNGHPEWDSRVTVLDGSGSGSRHAAHVMGTLIAEGLDADALGMAPGAQVGLFNSADDGSEMLTWGAGSASNIVNDAFRRFAVSNHSYGAFAGFHRVDGEWVWFGPANFTEDPTFGQYDQDSSDVDAACYAKPYFLPFFAAANDRNDVPDNGDDVDNRAGADFVYNGVPLGDGQFDGGFDTLSPLACAKNCMTVGSATDAVLLNDFRSTIFVDTSDFSSWGPTDDGRIKPDIVGNGQALYSSTNTWDRDTNERNDDYGLSSGTSMAAPNTCGSAALLVDYFEELFPDDAMRAATLKALIIHTTDDLGNAGPDYEFGWGLMNTLTAARLLDAHALAPGDNHLVESSRSASATQPATLSFYWDEENPIRVTMCYTDPAGPAKTGLDTATRDLVNDLDLVVIDPNGTSFRPYRLDRLNPGNPATRGDNDVDNVEQVFIENPKPGRYTIEVSHEGAFGFGTNQQYSLITTGGRGLPPTPTPIVIDVDNSAFFGFNGPVDPLFANRHPTAEMGWQHVRGNTGRNIIIGGAMRFDDSVNDAVFSDVHSTLHTSLISALFAETILEFDWRESGDEPNAIVPGGDGTGDGVSIRVREGGYYPIHEFTGTSTAWQHVRINLGEAAAAHGLLLGGITDLRFAQRDNFGWPDDGIEIDNVEVYVSQPGDFRFAEDELEVDETAGFIAVTINRTFGTQGAASVRLRTVPGTALPGTDYNPLDTIVNFADGESGKDVAIPINNTAAADGTRRFSIVLSNPTNGTGLASPSTTEISIIDDDLPAEIALDVSELRTATVRGSHAPSKSFRISNVGGAPLSYTISGTPSWITPSQGSGTISSGYQDITLYFTTNSLAPARYEADLTINAPGALHSPVTLPVRLLVGYSSGPHEFASTSAWIDLPGTPGDPRASVYPVDIRVQGLPGWLHKVAIGIREMESLVPGELDLLARAPDGEAVTLFSDIVESTPQKISRENFLFASSAGGFLPSSGPVEGGLYRPTNLGTQDDPFSALPAGTLRRSSLDAMSGGSPNGFWGLYGMDDDLTANEHRLRGWTLSLTTVELVEALAERFTESSPTNPFDLDGTALLFTPENTAAGYSVTRCNFTDEMLNSSNQTFLSLGDNESAELTPSQPVTLYDIPYSTIWISSNGYITFGADDSSPSDTISHHLQLPRISAMMGDLSPGLVAYSEAPDRLFVFYKVNDTSGNTNIFQIEIFFDGRIRIGFSSIESTSGFVTGLSRGNGDLASFGSQNFAATPEHPLVLRDASFDSNGFSTMRWTSMPEASYLLRYSLNLQSWTTFKSLQGGPGTDTIFSFQPPHPSPQLYFRVEKQ